METLPTEKSDNFASSLETKISEIKLIHNENAFPADAADALER